MAGDLTLDETAAVLSMRARDAQLRVNALASSIEEDTLRLAVLKDKAKTAVEAAEKAYDAACAAAAT